MLTNVTPSLQTAIQLKANTKTMEEEPRPYCSLLEGLDPFLVTQIGTGGECPPLVDIQDKDRGAIHILNPELFIPAEECNKDRRYFHIHPSFFQNGVMYQDNGSDQDMPPLQEQSLEEYSDRELQMVIEHQLLQQEFDQLQKDNVILRHELAESVNQKVFLMDTILKQTTLLKRAGETIEKQKGSKRPRITIKKI